jgi:PIN domain nuclease of toxin-antitoxin system
MKVLLDTHVFLWMISAPEKLSQTAKITLESEDNKIFLSAVSGWEIAIKYQIGKLELPENPEVYVNKQVEENFIEVLPIELKHALHVHSLPGIHKDPFDRMLIAQSKLEGLQILTNDGLIEQYDAETLW